MSRSFEILYSNHEHPLSFFLFWTSSHINTPEKKKLNQICWDNNNNLLYLFATSYHFWGCIESIQKSKCMGLILRSFGYAHLGSSCLHFYDFKPLTLMWYITFSFVGCWSHTHLRTLSREETLLCAQSDHYWQTREETYYDVCNVVSLHRNFARL